MPGHVLRRAAVLRTESRSVSRECCEPDRAAAPRQVVRIQQPTEDLSVSGVVESARDGDDHDHDDLHHLGGADEESRSWWRDPGMLLPVASGVLLLAGYILERSAFQSASAAVLAVSLIAGAWTFVPGAVRRLLRGRLGVGLLMTIAAVGAVLLGHIGEAAALAFLFSIAEALEDRAMDRARNGLRALLSLIPETATVSRLSGDVVVAAADVQKQEILVVHPGERVATDGLVVDGISSINTSAITGESIPVEVEPGSAVPAGSINGSGEIRVKATSDGRDNSLTTIVALVEQAHARKGERARLADRIARPLVPAVLVLAALVVLYGFIVGDAALWIERALVVLVAASPCALAIAVPVTVISAIGAASKFGVVIKSGEAFEQLGSIDIVALDKTGTLTRGRPEVVAVDTTGGYSREQVLAVAAGLEAHSTHPLASAITAAAARSEIVAGVTENSGRGVTGVFASSEVHVGSPRWVPAGALSDVVGDYESQGMTIAVVEVDGQAVGVIGIRDELKPEAAEAISDLTEAGFEIVMLTGDNEHTARALAAAAGIGDVRAELLPAAKVAAVESLGARGRVAMIGDGINDAPALAAADVGIAMGIAGSDAAIESASVAFTGTDLRLIPQAMLHARRGRRIMTGNIVLSLSIIIVLLPMALFGVLGLAGVVLVHEIAEVVVILNGVRAAWRSSPTAAVRA